METLPMFSAAPQITAKTVLLVEDEFLIALREQDILEKHGMTVLMASDGKTAVEMALNAPTLDLILMDIDLGAGIDGTEAARRILAQRDLPIVFVSSHTSPDVVEKTENITAYGYIVKNSGETVLLASIKMAFKLFEAHQRLKQQDEALRESNALFLTQFELGNIGMTIASPDKEWLHVNQRLCEMLGYSEAELRQTTWSALTHPDDLAADVAQFERMQAGEIDLYEIEKRFIRKDGAILSTHLAVACYRNPDHSIRFTIGSILDITTRKSTEEALKESEALLRLVVENSRDGINLLDLRTGKYTFMSPSQVEMTGFTTEEINGISVEEAYDRVYPDDRHLSVEQQQQIAAGLNPPPVEYRWKVKNGEYRWFSDNRKLIRDAQGNPIAMVGISRDITDRKVAEEAVRESEARYRRFFDEDLTGDFITTPEGVLLDCNPAFLRIFGFAQKSDAIGRNIMEWYPDHSERQRIVAHIRTHRVLEAHETTRYRKDGSLMHVVLNFAGEFDATGELTCVRGYLFDNTARKQAENALRERERQLREFNAQKDKFFSILAHDLKNPLIGFLSFAELLESDFDNLPLAERTMLIQHFHVSAEMLIALLEDLLTWGRVQQDRIEYYPVEFPLELLIARAIALLSENAGQKQISLINAAAAPGKVYADVNMTDTILRNLIANAIKFTRPGGAVTISTTGSADGVRVTVADNGIGIPPDMLGDVFRLDGRTKRPGTNGEKGTGLGLILCKEFAEKQGGALWIESEPEKGTRVMFMLPAAA